MLLGLLACRDVDGTVLDEPIVAARLEKVSLHGLAILGGSFGGSADLVVDPVEGEPVTVPVGLRGGTLGLGVELIAYESGAFGIPLQLPPGRVTGNDVAGRYKGSATTLAVLVGVEVHHLRNPQGIELDAAAIPIGVGLMVGAEWMSIDPRETVLPDTGADDTGDTGGA